MSQVLMVSFGTMIDLSFITANAESILAERIGSDRNGNPLEGTMRNLTDPKDPDIIAGLNDEYPNELVIRQKQTAMVTNTDGVKRLSTRCTKGYVDDFNWIGIDADELGDVQPSEILSGKTATSENGLAFFGTSTNRTYNDGAVIKITKTDSRALWYSDGGGSLELTENSDGNVRPVLRVPSGTFTNQGFVGLADRFMLGNADSSNVLEGRTATSGYGIKFNGTMPNRGTPTTTPKNYNQTLSEGYYGNHIVLGDSDLIAANIKKGKNIFGVTGTYQGFEALTNTVIYQNGYNPLGLYIAGSSNMNTAVYDDQIHFVGKGTNVNYILFRTSSFANVQQLSFAMLQLQGIFHLVSGQIRWGYDSELLYVGSHSSSNSFNLQGDALANSANLDLNKVSNLYIQINNVWSDQGNPSVLSVAKIV